MPGKVLDVSQKYVVLLTLNIAVEFDWHIYTHTHLLEHGEREL